MFRLVRPQGRLLLPFADAGIQIVGSRAAGNNLSNACGTERDDGDKQHKSARPEPDKVRDDIVVLSCLLVMTTFPFPSLNLNKQIAKLNILVR